jgi:hypothetical protein
MADPVSPPPPVYRKLTRMSRGVGTMTQLWLGADHLLQVQSTGYTETYRRFYLRDIQTMLIVHTARRTYIAITLAVLLLIAVIIVVSADGGAAGAGIAAGIFLPFFLWNHLLGPGCRVVAVTAVQQENVPSLCRLPKTRRILANLRPLIEAAQGDLGSAPVAGGTTSPLSLASTPPIPPPLPSS